MKACQLGVVVLGAALAFWMAYDASRALAIGDYVVPKTGAYAGQLGLWASLLRRVGLEPRSNTVKVIFLVLSAFWLSAVALIALRPTKATMIWASIVALATLWYLPFGTLISVLVLSGLACMGFG